MVNPIFDAGVFIIMLILAPVLFFASEKFGILLLIPSTAIFVILGMVIVTGYDVTSYISTTDGITTFDETHWFIKNSMETGQIQWLGWIFLIIALISGAKFIGDIGEGKKLI